MCLYGFIPVFGGSSPPIHHPALCPDSPLHWQPHSYHPFYCSLYTDLWTCFHSNTPCCSHSDGSLKVEWVAEPSANNPQPLYCGASLTDLLCFCSASSVIFMYDLSVCVPLPSILGPLLLSPLLFYPAAPSIWAWPFSGFSSSFCLVRLWVCVKRPERVLIVAV